jgi:26S proteasome regulatory subunit T4
MASTEASSSTQGFDQAKIDALKGYRQKLRDHSNFSENLKKVRMNIRALNADYEKTEEDMKALQSVGQIIGEVLKQLDDERFIVKASSGPRYVVSYRPTLPAEKVSPPLARANPSSRPACASPST